MDGLKTQFDQVSGTVVGMSHVGKCEDAIPGRITSAKSTSVAYNIKAVIKIKKRCQ